MGFYSRHCERSEAIHCEGSKNGLLRGAWHRARIRATRWLAMTEGETELSHHHLVADDLELDEVHAAKARGERHVGGVAAGAHQDAAGTRVIMAGVEGVPLAGQI